MTNHTMSAKVGSLPAGRLGASGGKKILIYSLMVFGLLFNINSALAFDSNSIVLNNVPYATFQKGTFDDLVLDFNLLVVNPDVLKSIGLRNLGSANYFSQIKYLKLWADDGPLGFQGMGIDREIGNFSSSADQPYWYIENLSEKIVDSERFFVSVETYSTVSQSATIQLQIPQLVDKNGNGSFDFGDVGIFMDSGNNGPVNEAINNSAIQVFSDYNYDNMPPKILVTDLANGDLVNSGDFIIKGKIRDQGNSQLASFTMKINDQTIDLINSVDPNTYSWSYVWKNISDGEYIISLQSYDSSSNLAAIAPFTINARKQNLNIANSIVIIDKISILADGLDKATVTVNLKDEQNFPIIGLPISVDADPDLIVSLPDNLADHSGQVIFEVRSTSTGVKNFTVNANGQVLKTLSVKAGNLDLAQLGINYGDLIKSASNSVYYFAADGKRYVFQSLNVYLSWYKNFSNIKNISNENLTLIPLGGVVTYRPGFKMIKIASNPKAYAVDGHATLRWVKTEAAAKALYGNNWATQIDDVSVAFFSDYKMGADIETNIDFNPAMVLANVGTINEDKGLK